MKNVANVVIALVLAWATPATAVVIYNNGTTPSNGFVSDTDFPTFVADDFTLAPGANVISSVQWTGLYAFSNTPTQPDNFTIQFFATVAGSPAVTPFLSLNIGNPGRTNTGLIVAGSNLFSYSASVAPIAITPNTVVWLSIFNNTSADTNDNWLWGMQDQLGNNFERAAAADPWLARQNRQDFQLTGSLVAVAEPSALALLAIGVVGLLGCRRRRTTR